MRPSTNALPCLTRSTNPSARARALCAATAVAATALIAALTLTGAAPAFAVDRISVTPGPDGAITAMTGPDANGIRYVAGAFQNFDLVNTGSGLMTDGTTDAINRTFPRVGFSGTSVAVADGSGGVYIGGSGTPLKVDGVEYNGVAHINADGSLDTSWNPNVNGSVQAIAVSGSTVYLGGSFTTVGGTTRNNAAAVNKTSGGLTSWNPNADGLVNSVVISGANIYLGGNFDTVGGAGGAARSKAAAVDTTTGAATGWDPNVTGGYVYSLAVSGSTVYLVGDFTAVGGTTRNRAAAVDSATGTLTSWNPNLNSNVYSVVVSGSTVYLGGWFDTVGGVPSNKVAAVGTDGTLKSWNPPWINSGVYALMVSGSTVYLGGAFTLLGGNSQNNDDATPRRGAAAVGTDGSLKGWNPSPAGSMVTAIAATGSNVFIGGDFRAAGGVERRYVAAVGNDGTATSWNPTLDGAVNAISLSGSTVSLGGAFRKVNGVQRDYFAAIGTDGTLLAPWYGGTGPGSTPDPDPTPTTKPAKPAAAWSSSAKAKTVTAVITPVTGVAFTLTATSGRVTKTGSCKNVTIKQGKSKVARRSCTIKLAKGKWLAAVTPKKGSVSGTVNSKSYSFK
jgi:hypothetical protein